MIKTGELEKVMAEYEKIARRLPAYGVSRFEREEKAVWDKQRYYVHTPTNQSFTAYLWGYAMGRVAERVW